MMNSQLNVKASRPNQRTVTKRFTMRVMKENITDKITKIKKYSKWMVLMQLPMVYPSLYKYCSFDYNAFLIKKK